MFKKSTVVLMICLTIHEISSVFPNQELLKNRSLTVGDTDSSDQFSSGGDPKDRCVVNGETFSGRTIRGCLVTSSTMVNSTLIDCEVYGCTISCSNLINCQVSGSIVKPTC